MVDIYEIAPQDTARPLRAAPSPFAYAGQEARLMRYQHLLSKLSLSPDDSGAASGVQVDFLPQDGDDDDRIELHSNASVKAESDAPLVGTFADAAQAMA